jgi:hypothetical protein
MSCLTCSDPQKDEETAIEIAEKKLHQLHVKAIHKHKQKVHHNTIVDDARTEWAKNYSFLIFVVIVSGLTICEPFLVGFNADVNSQIGVQFASFAMMLIGTLFSMSYCDERAKDFSLAKKIYVCFDGQCQFELICLLYGIITLFTIPEYSAFRIIRCIRLMYYVEEFQPDVDIKYPEDNFFSPLRACRLTLMYMEALAEEILSERSKGGIVVLIMFFYQCFITACICYYVLESRGLNVTTQNNDENGGCGSIRHCYITVLRLSVGDGNGFDLMEFAMNNNLFFLFWILIFHMVFTAIVLLNGLVGIFGAAFNDVHIEESDDETVEDAAPPVEDLPEGDIGDIKALVAAQNAQIQSLISKVGKLAQAVKK